MVIDTSVFIEHLRAKDKTTTALFKIQKSHSLFASTITAFELYAGANTPNKWADVELLLSKTTLLHFGKIHAQKSGEIFQKLRAEKLTIEFRDVLIAAAALENNMPIMTFNKKHFLRIEGLDVR